MIRKTKVPECLYRSPSCNCKKFQMWGQIPTGLRLTPGLLFMPSKYIYNMGMVIGWGSRPFPNSIMGPSPHSVGTDSVADRCIHLSMPSKYAMWRCRLFQVTSHGISPCWIMGTDPKAYSGSMGVIVTLPSKFVYTVYGCRVWILIVSKL